MTLGLFKYDLTIRGGGSRKENPQISVRIGEEKCDNGGGGLKFTQKTREIIFLDLQKKKGGAIF